MGNKCYELGDGLMRCVQSKHLAERECVRCSLDSNLTWMGSTWTTFIRNALNSNLCSTDIASTIFSLSKFCVMNSKKCGISSIHFVRARVVVRIKHGLLSIFWVILTLRLNTAFFNYSAEYNNFYILGYLLVTYAW